MAQKQKSPLNHLLKAPKKDAVAAMCNQAILYKDLAADQIPDLVIAQWSATLKITKGETKQLMVALAALLKQAVFLYASDPAKASNAFPADFNTDLQALLITIIGKNFAEWKTNLASSNSHLPKLVGVSCQVDSSTASEALDVIPTNQANCILQLKIQDGDLSGDQKTRLVDVKLSKEKLNAMLDGLGKIRDQLTSVTQR